MHSAQESSLGSAVVARGLTKLYEGVEPVSALTDVTFEVPPGTAIAVTGSSASGKSTLLHLLGAMDSPTSGELHVGGVALTGLTGRERTEFRRRVGFVFQRFHLLANLTVLENVIAPLL